MIGIPELLIFVGFLLFDALFIWLGWTEFRGSRRWRGLAVLLLFASLFVLECRQELAYNGEHATLHALRAQDVLYVEVGGTKITDPSAVSAVVRSMSDVERFVGRNIGADWVPLQVHLRDGRQYYYDVAPRLGNTGALVSYGESRATRRGPFSSAGRFYSKDLLDVLRSVGAADVGAGSH